jgi:hypothetical protein
MKINTTMPEKLVPYFNRELTEAAVAFKSKHFQVSWRHLERAHILGQPYPLTHTFVHLKMLFYVKFPGDYSGPNWPSLLRNRRPSLTGIVTIRHSKDLFRLPCSVFLSVRVLIRGQL